MTLSQQCGVKCISSNIKPYRNDALLYWRDFLLIARSLSLRVFISHRLHSDKMSRRVYWICCDRRHYENTPLGALNRNIHLQSPLMTLFEWVKGLRFGRQSTTTVSHPCGDYLIKRSVLSLITPTLIPLPLLKTYPHASFYAHIQLYTYPNVAYNCIHLLYNV